MQFLNDLLEAQFEQFLLYYRMGAIIPIIVQLLPLLVQIPGDVSALLSWINSFRTATQTAGAWTDEAETAWRASVAADFVASEQQEDSKGNAFTSAR